MEAATLVRQARAEAGLTQVELARRLGVTQASLARLERLGANPTVGTLERVVRATGRRLELRLERAEPSVDATLLREALTPGSAARSAVPDGRRPADFGLTPREIDVLLRLAEGLTNKEIGGQLSIAEDTVKKHVQNIIWKLRAADRTQAAIVAYRAGLLDPMDA